MFHVFAVVKRRENMPGSQYSKDRWYCTHHGACRKVWDSPTEEAGKEKTTTNIQYIQSTMNISQCDRSCRELYTHWLLCSMCIHAVVKRRENMAVISKGHWYCTHHWGMLKRVFAWDSLPEVGQKRKQNSVHNNHKHAHASQCCYRRCDDALLTGCYVRCIRVPSEEERKHSSQQLGLWMCTAFWNLESSGLTDWRGIKEG